MKKFLLPFLFSLLLLGFNSYAQDQSLEDGVHEDLASQVEIHRVPANGSFITLRVATFDPYYLRHDPNMLVRFAILKPVYCLIDNVGKEFFSIGCFSTIEECKKCRNELKCVFDDAYPVAFKNGVHVNLNEYSDCNQRVQYPNYGKALKGLKKLINRGYYRVQFGYYESPGLEPAEQEMYNKLEKAGIEVIEEKYDAGRRYVTRNRFTSYRDANAARYKMVDIAGKWCALAEYDKPYYLLHNYLDVLHDCLSSIK